MEHGGNFAVPDQTSIWPCNKRGKKTSDVKVFTQNKKDMEDCLDNFLDTFGIE
jgi:hypothetical protein